MSDAAERIVRNERAIRSRHEATAIATPTSTAPTISTAVPSTPFRLSTCTPNTAPSAPRNTWWSTSPAGRLPAPTAISTASSASAGPKVTTSANRTMSDGVDPRTAKNSAFLPRMSNSGCARANPETASSWAPRTAGSRKRWTRLVRVCVIEDACSTRELFGAHDRKTLGERALERLSIVVGMRPGLLAHEERGDARVLPCRELDDQRRPECGEPGEDLGQGNVPADRDVVDDGQAQGQLRPAALLEGLALETVPTERG